MSNFITGVVNEYYATAGEAEAGLLPVWRDEVYARQSLRDPAQWDVLRLTVQPVLPRGHHGKLTELLVIAALMNPSFGNEVQTIAKGVDVRTAFDMVRQHEESPPALLFEDEAHDLYTLKQVRELENSNTDWQRFKF